MGWLAQSTGSFSAVRLRAQTTAVGRYRQRSPRGGCRWRSATPLAWPTTAVPLSAATRARVGR